MFFNIKILITNKKFHIYLFNKINLELYALITIKKVLILTKNQINQKAKKQKIKICDEIVFQNFLI